VEHADDGDAEGQRRYLTVMFCDLVGSTALSTQLDPEDMRQVIRTYQARCLDLVSAHDGSVAQYLGDGILAYFGYPAAHEDDAVQAVRAALAITSAMSDMAHDLGLDQLAARVGLQTGLVVIGDMTSYRNHPLSGDVLAIGETPNIAARLQALAAPGQVVLGKSTAMLVEGYFVLESMGTPELKGASRPIEAFRVLGETAAHSRLDAHLDRGLTQLVGRGTELAVLEGLWRAVAEGSGSVALIEGEPGIGKSRLTMELVARVRAEDAPVVELWCSPRHTNSVLHPVVDLLERELAAASLHTNTSRLDLLEDLARRSGLDAASSVPILAELIDLPLDGRYPPAPTSPEVLRERTFQVLTSTLFGRVGDRGLLVVLEDAQWVDPTTQEVVQTVLDAVESSAVLVVVTRRTETPSTWPESVDVRLPLGKLGDRAIQQMIEELAAGRAVPDEVTASIRARTDGVPLFVEELTRMLLDATDRQTDQADDGRAVPVTLRDLLMARLDRLGPAASVARLAATVGREVPHAFLRRVWKRSPDELETALRDLVDSGLLLRRGSGDSLVFLFKHALVQDVAYDTQLKSQRQSHHLAIALEFEAELGHGIPVLPETVAHHFTAGGHHHRAVPYWIAAGTQALERSANREAVAHLGAALDLVRTLPDTQERDRLELSVLVLLGAPLMGIRGYGSVEVEDVYRRAHELGDALDDPVPLFDALYGMFRVHLLRAEYDVALGIGRRLEALADAARLPTFRIAAQRAIGSALTYVGDDADPVVHLDRAVAIDAELRSAPDTRGPLINDVADAAITSAAYSAWVHWLRGDVARARATADDAVARAVDLGHPFTISLSSCFDLWLRQFEDDVEGVILQAQEALAFARDESFTFWLGWTEIMHGWAVARTGAHADGVAEIRKGLLDWQATGSRLGSSYFLSLLGESLLLSGLPDESLETLTEARAFSLERNEHFWLPEIHRLRGAVHLERRELAQARRELTLAITLAEANGAVSLRARAQQTLRQCDVRGAEDSEATQS
jgi:class 3 adenylate cyclase